MFGKKPSRTYLDYASATPLLPEVGAAMHAAEARFGNPGSIHAEGVTAKALLEEARRSIASELGAKSGQVIFTSGLTESNNLAILGFARRVELSGGSIEGTHWITTAIEHSSVLEPFAEIERRGGQVTHVEPDSRGLIGPEIVARALRPDTVFVSIGWGNNEIGIVQDLSAISRAVHTKAPAVVFHSDAGQAPLYLSPHVHTLGVDAFSFGAGKLYGPRSIGALYLQDASRFAGVLVGGGQEKGLRSGTEDVAPAAGFAKAFEIISRERAAEWKRLQKLRDTLASRIEERVPRVIFNGAMKHSLPHMLNISIPGINAEYLVLALDREGFALSTRSACNANDAQSHVVAALGGEEWRAKNTLRISLGRDTSKKDIERLSEILPEVIKRSSKA